MIRIQKTPIIPDFHLSRQVSPQMLSVSPVFSTQADGSRMRNLSRQLMSGSSTSALILPQSCLLLFVLTSLRHRFGAANKAEILSAAERAEMVDVEQLKKIVPLVTCEITFGQ